MSDPVNQQSGEGSEQAPGTIPVAEPFPAFGSPGTLGGPSDPGRPPPPAQQAALQTTTAVPVAAPAGSPPAPAAPWQAGGSSAYAAPTTSPAPAATGLTARPYPLAGLAIVGLFTALLGAWAAISVLVGPTFGWSPDGTGSWKFGTVHLVLHVIPGAAALLAGAVMLATVPSSAKGSGRLAGALAGALAILSAVWLVCGPFYWPVLRPNDVVFLPGSSAIRDFTYFVGPNLGAGLLIGLLGATVVAWALRNPSARRL